MIDEARMRWTLGVLLAVGMWVSGYIVGNNEWGFDQQANRTALVNAAADVVGTSISACEVQQRRADSLKATVNSLRYYKPDQFRLGWWMEEGRPGEWLYICPWDRGSIVPRTGNAYLIGLWRQAINLKIELSRNSPCGPQP